MNDGDASWHLQLNYWQYNNCMARSARIQYEGAFYHVMNRGNDRKNIFLDNQDRNKFYEILGVVEEKYGIMIYAFVLMNNHYLCWAQHNITIYYLKLPFSLQREWILWTFGKKRSIASTRYLEFTRDGMSDAVNPSLEASGGWILGRDGWVKKALKKLQFM